MYLQIFLPKVVVMYILGALAIAFYALKFPECIFPGWFGQIDSSMVYI